MPYIDEAAKQRLASDGQHPETVGELTYLFSMHCINADARGDHTFLAETLKIEVGNYLLNQTVSYAVLCGVVGSLECARREHRRRRPDNWLGAGAALSEVQEWFYNHTVAPYEDTKIEQNGDVYL